MLRGELGGEIERVGELERERRERREIGMFWKGNRVGAGTLHRNGTVSSTSDALRRSVNKGV